MPPLDFTFSFPNNTLFDEHINAPESPSFSNIPTLGSSHGLGSSSSTSQSPSSQSWPSNNMHQNNPSQYTQYIRTLEDTITKLRIENASIESSRAAIEKAYTSLISQLNRTTEANNTSSTSSTSTSMNVALRLPNPTNPFLDPPPLPKLKSEDYPSVRFWTRQHFVQWKETAEGQAVKSPHPFLEDENGTPLTEARVSKISSDMRNIFHTFRGYNLINSNMTWTKLPFNLKKTFRSEIVTSFPELNYCEDAWKLDKYAKSVFNSFKQTWITNKSKDKTTSSGKRVTKSEDSESTDADVAPPMKRLKLDNIVLPVSPIKSQSSSSSIAPISLTESSNSAIAATDSIDSVSGLADVSSPVLSVPRPSVSTSLDPEMDVVGANPPSQDSDNLKTLSVTACLNATALASTRTDKFTTINVPVNNPLASMSHAQLPALSSPVQSVLLPAAGSPSQVEDTNAPARGPAPVNTSKTMKAVSATSSSSWRPPSAKNGRNLCAHRWLKQVKPNGTREEFNVFYSSLSAVVKAKYKEEASKLVSNGIWAKNTVENIAQIAALPMAMD